MSLHAVLALLPYRLRNRFTSLSGYVDAAIEQAEDRYSRGHANLIRLSDGDREGIRTMALVVAIGRFLQDGTRAASFATDAFSSLGVGGFSVGGTTFEGRN